MLLLGILDFLFVSHAYHSILTRGASVQLVFGFEVSSAGVPTCGGCLRPSPAFEVQAVPSACAPRRQALD